MFSIPSQKLYISGQQEDCRSGQRHNGGTEQDHRPVPALFAVRLAVRKENDGNDWPQYSGDDFYYPEQRKHIDPRIHFSVRKSDTDRRFVEALGNQIAGYALIASILILGIFAVVGATALIEYDRQLAIAARV